MAPLVAGPWQGFTCLVLGTDQRTFATGGRGGEVMVWDLVTGEVLERTVFADGKPVLGLRPGPSGASYVRAPAVPPVASWRTLVARGTSDGQIVVTEGPSGPARLAWQAHRAPVTGLGWSAVDGTLVSCASDGTLCRWDPQTGKLLGSLENAHP